MMFLYRVGNCKTNVLFFLEFRMRMLFPLYYAFLNYAQCAFYRR